MKAYLQIKEFLEEKGYWEIFVYIFFWRTSNSGKLRDLCVGITSIWFQHGCFQYDFLDLFSVVRFCNK